MNLKSMKSFGLLIMNVVLFNQIACSQNDTVFHQKNDFNFKEREITYDINGKYLKTFPQTLWYTTSAPARWQKKDFLKAGIIVGSIGTTMLLDKEIKSVVQAIRNQTIDDIFNTVEPFGNRYSPYVLLGLYGLSKVIKDERLQHTTLVATRNFAVSTAHYVATKALVRRLRPDMTNDPFIFKAPFTPDYTSFPSGHTNTVFSIATIYALEYRDKKWVPWTAYGIASLTGVSRIVQNRHWASDVLIGAVIGHFTAKLQYAWEQKNNRKKQVVPLF